MESVSRPESGSSASPILNHRWRSDGREWSGNGFNDGNVVTRRRDAWIRNGWNDGRRGNDVLRPMWGAVGTVTAVSVGLGAVLIVGGYYIQKSPESARKWGTAILIISIISLIGMSGFFIGPLLGIIGGILALTKK